MESNSSLKSTRLLLVIYTERCHSLWKQADVIEWLQDVALALLPRFSNGDAEVAHYADWRATKFFGLPLNIQRHVLLSDFAPAMGLLPSATGSLLFSITKQCHYCTLTPSYNTMIASY